MGLAIDVAQRRAGLHPRRSACPVDEDALHARQVDDDPVVAQRPAADVVAAAADRDEQSLARANFTAWTTSATPAQRAIRPGRLSMLAFQMRAPLVARIALLDCLSGNGRCKTVEGFLGDRQALPILQCRRCQYGCFRLLLPRIVGGTDACDARARKMPICRRAGTFDRRCRFDRACPASEIGLFARCLRTFRRFLREQRINRRQKLLSG